MERFQVVSLKLRNGLVESHEQGRARWHFLVFFGVAAGLLAARPDLLKEHLGGSDERAEL